MLSTAKGKYLVEYVEATNVSPGGIILPSQTTKTALVKSRVIAHPREESCTKFGDYIWFPVGGATEVSVNDRKFFLVGEGNIVTIESV